MTPEDGVPISRASRGVTSRNGGTIIARLLIKGRHPLFVWQAAYRKGYMERMRKAIVDVCRWLAVVAVAAGVGACGGSDSPSAPSGDTAMGLRVSGDGQRGFAGQLLNKPISVQVVDSAFRAIGGKHLIRFSVVQGGGSVSDTELLSDESGLATVSWILGPALGLQQLAVRLADAPSSREGHVMAQALPLDSADLILVSGATSGTIGLLVRKDDAVSPYTLAWPDTVLRLVPRSAEGWEEVAAFTVGHPPVSILQPWSANTDTVRVAFQSAISVRFTVWLTHDFDTTAARVRHDVAALDLFWRSHMTGLRVGQVRIDSAPGLLFDCGQSPGGFDVASINLYYTEFPSPVTCDARIIRMHRNNPLSFSEGSKFILAHEVGHAMSLGHVSDPTNVMWPQPPTGFGLTTGQIYRMHFDSWGALNSVLNIHPAAERNCNVLLIAHCLAETFAVW